MTFTEVLNHVLNNSKWEITSKGKDYFNVENEKGHGAYLQTCSLTKDFTISSTVKYSTMGWVLIRLQAETGIEPIIEGLECAFEHSNERTIDNEKMERRDVIKKEIARLQQLLKEI